MNLHFSWKINKTDVYSFYFLRYIVPSYFVLFVLIFQAFKRVSHIQFNVTLYCFCFETGDNHILEEISFCCRVECAAVFLLNEYVDYSNRCCVGRIGLCPRISWIQPQFPFLSADFLPVSHEEIMSTGEVCSLLFYCE